MSKGLRLTEVWMQRALWLVAFVFAAFLIGLGGKIVDNLRDVEPAPAVEQFIDAQQAARAQGELTAAMKARDEAGARLEQAQQKHESAVSNTQAARKSFNNWVATRQATARPDQDTELINRTRSLDALEGAERDALRAIQAEEQKMLDARQAANRAQQRLDELEGPAREAAAKAARMVELRVFGLRLALTLPLLVVAGWLFAKKRQGSYWPFAWGFIFFALFAFFFELVPYLPSYGGYVRYIVGIVVTVLVGRYAIVSLQRYLERQKAAEALPDVQRRETLRYDTAIRRLEKSVCPGCERTLDLKDKALDYCPHCGIGLFDHCGRCTTRKSAFSRFCFSCGTPANTSLAD
ncbi:zinc ribbon domain-containing protein [Massilia solisilvae]|uniref:Zinc ribbon domain-containing protein n=1 Tax=Massilia solisilvae TaxID=1811225 RepID=A0ABT2BJ14_9BURK|nr:zinc ribbon domain-containing protein [Massilia solisilvae]MCS0608465.1 zinc ribbon domain-containing protein [Massilia solisilvae]